MERIKLFLSLMLSGIFAFTWLSRVYAQDADANKGEAKAETRLEQKFNVSDARIDSLRKQKLGFGEISHVLSLAKQMPGGINDQNIDKVMALRQGQGGHKEGWGDVAHDLNLKLGSARDRDDIRGARHEELETQTHVSSGRSEERFETHHGSEGFHEEAGFHGGAGMGHQR